MKAPSDPNDLAAGARVLGVPLLPGVPDALWKYMAAILERGRPGNLTAVRDRAEVVERHLLDSLSGLRVLGELGDGGRVIDVGTGAGFPGVVLACARPGWRVHLVEAARRKASAVAAAAAAAGIDNVVVWAERAETLARDPGLRESFDAAVARAVAPLPVLAELTLPFVRAGGLVVAYKGPAVDEELGAGERAARVLGGLLERVDRFSLPWSGARRVLVVLRKAGMTPPAYPRRPGMPRKRPLGGPPAVEGPHAASQK